MYLQVKKGDSVTSILLFLFNVFLEQRGIKEISVKKILRLLDPFDKSETSIRMGLSRGVRNGLLINFKRQGQVYYGITSKAQENFKYWWETQQKFENRVPRQQAKWDGQWTLVCVKDEGLGKLLPFLEELSFGSLDKLLWVSPYGLTELALDQNRVLNNALVFRGILDNNRKPFELVTEIWSVKELNNKYQKYISFVNEVTTQAGALDDDGASLPVLHLCGLQFFEIMQDAPQLPIELLPEDWRGFEAARRFSEIRIVHLPKAQSYISRILGG